MIIKYGIEIEKDAVLKNLNRLTNQVFKLLPNREDGGDWKTPLDNIIVELGGLNSLLIDQVDLFSLLCRLEGLKDLSEEGDFLLFRKNIFECLNLMGKIKECLD